MSEQEFFTHDGLRLAYRDSGGDGPVLLALHGHLNEGRFVDEGAVPAGTGFRVIALDQRGHGDSDHDPGHPLDAYVGDAAALLDHLGVDRAVVLGHSLGAAVTYLLAAREPGRVTAMVVVDIGAVVADSLDMVLDWPRRAESRAALVEAFSFMGPNQEYVMREYADGWGVPWDPEEMVASQHELNGDHWSEWLASTCPTLLVVGSRSQVMTVEHAREMAERRPHTELAVLDAGHAVYKDAPIEYADVVGRFLAAHRPDRTG